ncbi:MAG TPA: thiamine pyrophosphate-dependent enzyme, partial [Usitatibacter sp.]|nr:thiamine pyrophosphate-dependent enzyme [Usitatibacter sp.]
MSTFHDRAQFEGVMAQLFERLMAAPAIARPLGETAMVVRFRYPDLGSVITFDFKRSPPAFSTDDGGQADVEMVQSSDTAHEFWLGRLNAVRAIATGKVRARGDVAKALKLLPAIRPAFAIYPEVLKARGLAEDARRAAPRVRARPSWERRLRALWPRHRELDRSRLPTDTVPPTTPEAIAPPTAVAPLPEEATALRVAMLERMLRIRALEETLAEQWEHGALPTAAIHLSTGQEAVAVGVCFALRADDVVATTHRGHGHMLAKGAPADKMMAEIFGKDSGLCQGKGGSMHVTDASIGALGANGIVGASPILAAGAALAFSHRDEDRVAVAFMGDGATNQGMFHEALNLAAAWKLPVLFVVENNGYGEFTSQRRSTPIERLSDRAASYGMPGVTIEGNDVDLVHRTARDLVRRAREGGGPALLECV